MKATVVRPKESYIRNVKENHREPLQPEPERPAAAVLQAAVGQDLLVDNAAAEDLQPLALEENLKLPGGFGEWKVIRGPACLDVTKERACQTIERPLHVLFDLIARVLQQERQQERQQEADSAQDKHARLSCLPHTCPLPHSSKSLRPSVWWNTG